MNEAVSPKDFIREAVAKDTAAGVYGGRVHTRFPPEPNGYLHIGHAKALCLNFEVAREFGGSTNLRFDDTNPIKEEAEYVEQIQHDIRWLGYDWGDRLFFASDYFETLYGYAVRLIEAGKAYVDELTAEEIREHRGTLREPGRESPHRNRPVEENLDLFRRMRGGEFPDGSKVLRARIDMTSPNLNLRDPVMYRILHARHHRTGDAWNIYPMYDWAHGQSDSIEGITHSLCSLEFEDHRPLYNWFLENLGIYKPRQIEFARLHLSHTVLSKRKLIQLVTEEHVRGWDDPRMPTLSGLRRRGCTPWAIRDFCNRIGVAKRDSMIALAQLEYSVREDLNRTAPRRMAVLHPLKVVIENYPEGRVEKVEAVNNPEDETAGTRTVPFSREIYIEADDFLADPPKKYFRLAPGREVRLKHAYFIRCREAVENEAGETVELRCTYDPDTRGGAAPDGRKVQGTLHWVSAAHAVPAEVRVYDTLFTHENPASLDDFRTALNRESLRILSGCLAEPGLRDAEPGARFQFLRHGYYCLDPDTTGDTLVFNRTVSLKDSWARIQNRG